MKRMFMGAAFAAAFAAAPALAAEPAVIYDMGGKFDKSFNEAAYNGAEKYKADKGVAYRDYEVTNEVPARAGAPQFRPPWLHPDRRHGLRPGGRAEKSSPRNSPTPNSRSSTWWSISRT